MLQKLFDIMDLGSIRERIDAAGTYLSYSYESEGDLPTLTPDSPSTGAVVGPNRDAAYDNSVKGSGL